MTPEVAKGVAELRATFPNAQVTVREDGEGGAFVTIDELKFDHGCNTYIQAATWVGFKLTFQYPYSDVYPIFIRGDLVRKDGQPLGEAMSSAKWEGRGAIQVSRRSNKRDVLVDNAAIKVQKVIRWICSRP